MANQDVYKEWSFLLGSTAYPFTENSLAFSQAGEKNEQFIGSNLLPAKVLQDLDLPLGAVTLKEVDVVTDITAFGSGESITSATFSYRQKAEGGLWGTGYENWELSKGVLVPSRVSARGREDATLELMVYGLYASGSDPLSKTTSSKSQGDMVSYRIRSVSVGGSAVANVSGVEINYEFGQAAWLPPNNRNPENVDHPRNMRRGSITLLDGSEATAARLRGATEALVFTFENKEDDADTIEISITKADITGGQKGNDTTLEFIEKVA